MQNFFDGAGTFYVLNGRFQPDITEYPLGATKPARVVRRGIGRVPLGAAADSAGNLWVLNGGGPLVRYKAAKTMPEFATYNGLCANFISLGPGALAVDRFGTAYVGVTCQNLSGSVRALIREYDGSPSVARSIRIPSNDQPADLAVDEDGTLYVEVWDASDSGRLGILEYARGSTKPTLTFAVTPKVDYTSGFLNFAGGKLYLSLGSCNGISSKFTCSSYVTVYKQASSKHLRTIPAPANAIFGGNAVDAAGNIYVQALGTKPNGTTRLLVYAPNSDKPRVFLTQNGLGTEPKIYPKS